MIPKNYIQEWSKIVPWQEPRQVEQDLIITGVLLKIYENQILKRSLAFRGGTALNKLFFNPPTRYSEDIDLVQITPAPIGAVIDLIRSVLDSWLGEPKRFFSEGLVTLAYKVVSEDGFPIRIKVEINSREHFSVLGFQDYPFVCSSSWMQGKVMIRSFKLEELLGTKMRALYQRRKGRDLYDLHTALILSKLNVKELLTCFSKYVAFGGNCISKTSFLENMELKLKNKEFREDILPLLPRHRVHFDPDEAYKNLMEKLIKYL